MYSSVSKCNFRIGDPPCDQSSKCSEPTSVVAWLRLLLPFLIGPDPNASSWYDTSLVGDSECGAPELLAESGCWLRAESGRAMQNPSSGLSSQSESRIGSAFFVA
jgi:hypothetical protein